MRNINVNLKENAYKIAVGQRTLSQLGTALKALKIGKDAVIITNSNIQRLHGPSLLNGLKRRGFSAKIFAVPNGEKSKSAKVAMKLLEDIAKYDVNKELFIIAFGGGVVGDLAGYVAAIYKRGVPYVQVPTTLLAQIDSAIGGKTGIDLSCGKNLVGAIYQPKIVWSDVSILRTLDQRQIRNGLSEAVKYGVIRDKKLFDFIAKNYKKLLGCDLKAMEKVVIACSQIKANVVKQDEKETKGIRTILNFGHTIGHAIESAAKYDDYHHGEAIALGMRAAADISSKMGMLSVGNVFAINKVLTDIKLPQRITKVSLKDVLDRMAHDKKFKGKKNRFVLAKQIGRVQIVEGISMDYIRKSIKGLM